MTVKTALVFGAAALTYKNTEGYRGIYKDNDFYVAGNGEIKHFKLAE